MSIWKRALCGLMSGALLCSSLMATEQPPSVLFTPSLDAFAADNEYESVQTPYDALQAAEEIKDISIDDPSHWVYWKAEGDQREAFEKLQAILESDSEDTKYVRMEDDEHRRKGYDEWKPISITTDKVLDLNGHELTFYDMRNKENGDSKDQARASYNHNSCLFTISNGATLTIIDSSKEQTGLMYIHGFMINPFDDHRLRRYTTRDLFRVDDGNLVIYGGKFVAGESKALWKSESVWGKIKSVIGNAVGLGASVVAYSTGISSAVADLNISQDKLEKIIEEQKKRDNDSTDTPHETPISVSEVKTENAPEEKQSQQPSSEAEKRDQTISEKQQQKPNTNNNPNDNTADAKKPTKADAEKEIVTAKNAIAKAATDSSGLTDIINKGFDLADSIVKACKATTKDAVAFGYQLGTVVTLRNNSTFVSYGGQYYGTGMTPWERNAVIECTPNSEAYIYGGDFNAQCCANVFNIISADSEYTHVNNNGAIPNMEYTLNEASSEKYDVNFLEYSS